MSQSKKLHRLKQLKSQISLGRVTLRKSEFAAAVAAENEANRHLSMVITGADDKRMERLKEIFEARGEHAGLHHMAVGTWLQTERDLIQAHEDLAYAQNMTSEASQRLRLAQADLAQKMREEHKAEKLCSIIVERMEKLQFRRS